MDAVLQVIELRRVLEGEIAALAARARARARSRQGLQALGEARSTRRWPPAMTASPRTWPFTAPSATATGNPQFARLLAFLEQYLREAMRVTKAKRGAARRLHAAGARRTLRDRRRDRGARCGGARAAAIAHLVNGEERLVQGGVIPRRVSRAHRRSA
jgi:GntR family transcriptional repressor for pyruvate dehydrogenase complex